MKRMMLLCVAAALSASGIGCQSCHWLCKGPSCNSCNDCGTYGTTYDMGYGGAGECSSCGNSGVIYGPMVPGATVNGAPAYVAPGPG